MCDWFRNCDAPPTGSVPHPILGDVPTCDECYDFAVEDTPADSHGPDNPGDTLGPCGCIDYHMADCDGGSPGMTKEDYLDLYAGSYPDDWPDEGGY